ncbi:hypothetical protein CP533_0021 [Ophiocordyceps camponoti-saundersi (nom. inval.)]|nr:hypothetical protein CP533_0021 [Ophiocordyceps camponoti-saundersi (nom. inval.)]
MKFLAILALTSATAMAARSGKPYDAGSDPTPYDQGGNSGGDDKYGGGQSYPGGKDDEEKDDDDDDDNGGNKYGEDPTPDPYPKPSPDPYEKPSPDPYPKPAPDPYNKEPRPRPEPPRPRPEPPRPEPPRPRPQPPRPRPQPPRPRPQPQCKKPGEKCNLGLGPDFGCCKGRCVPDGKTFPGAPGRCEREGGGQHRQPQCKKPGEKCNLGLGPDFGCCKGRCVPDGKTFPGAPGRCEREGGGQGGYEKQPTCKKEGEDCNLGVGPGFGCCKGRCVPKRGTFPGAPGKCEREGGGQGGYEKQPTCKKEGEDCNLGVGPGFGCCEGKCVPKRGTFPGAPGRVRLHPMSL